MAKKKGRVKDEVAAGDAPPTSASGTVQYNASEAGLRKRGQGGQGDAPEVQVDDGDRVDEGLNVSDRVDEGLNISDGGMDSAVTGEEPKSAKDLFAKGVALETQGDVDGALAAFRECLKEGVNGGPALPALPGDTSPESDIEGHQISIATCLRMISDLLGRKAEYQLALQFRQAEKLLYEKALLHVVELEEFKVSSDERKERMSAASQSDDGYDRDADKSEGAPAEAGTKDGSTTDGEEKRKESGPELDESQRKLLSELYESTDSKNLGRKKTTARSAAELKLEERASSYQTLSEVFFSERKFDVALDYASKSIKIRQAVDDGVDPRAVQGENIVDKLMHFSHVGKEKYKDAMERYKVEKDKGSDSDSEWEYVEEEITASEDGDDDKGEEVTSLVQESEQTGDDVSNGGGSEAHARAKESDHSNSVDEDKDTTAKEDAQSEGAEESMTLEEGVDTNNQPKNPGDTSEAMPDTSPKKKTVLVRRRKKRETDGWKNLPPSKKNETEEVVVLPVSKGLLHGSSWVLLVCIVFVPLCIGVALQELVDEDALEELVRWMGRQGMARVHALVSGPPVPAEELR